MSFCSWIRLNFAYECEGRRNPLLGRDGAQRQGGFLVADTHPEAFGFYPSQEGIAPHSWLS